MVQQPLLQSLSVVHVPVHAVPIVPPQATQCASAGSPQQPVWLVQAEPCSTQPPPDPPVPPDPVVPVVPAEVELLVVVPPLVDPPPEPLEVVELPPIEHA